MIPDSNTRLLIVGGGIAAARLCEALRTRGYTGGIEVLCGEDALPYDRPPLSKAALAQESDTTFPVDYDALTVAVRTGVTATGLDTAARVVYATDGEHPYDLLVIATGAEPVQVPGAAQHTLRTATDAGRLRSELRPGARVALIGAGWIGAEIATAARGAGCEVVCVEAASAPLAKPIGADLGLRTLPWWSDVDLRLDTPVAEVTERGLRLQCGSEVAADVVVTGVGVRPATTWLRDSGVELDPATGAVLVDEHLRANVSGVYAVGDVCARWSPRFGTRLPGEHWDEARTGPATVAAAVVGAVEPFDPVPYFWSDQFGHKLQFVGHRSPSDEPILRLGQGETWGVAWVDAEDRLTAHLSVDAPRYMVAARAAIEKNTVVDRDTVGDLTAPLRPRLPEPDLITAEK